MEVEYYFKSKFIQWHMPKSKLFVLVQVALHLTDKNGRFLSCFKQVKHTQTTAFLVNNSGFSR